MRYQEQLVRATQKALDDVCRAARAVDVEQHTWEPGGHARSVLNQMQEIAASGTWFLPIFRDLRPPEFDEHARREAVRLRESYDTVEKCIEAARASLGDLCQVMANFPDELLDHEVQMPFGGGMRLTMADTLSMPSWNMIYHLGQINQIQLMLGDREMH